MEPKPVDRALLERYLQRAYGPGTRLNAVTPLGHGTPGEAGKTYGYGQPLRLDYTLSGGASHSAVFHTMRPSPFGHETVADRAQTLLWSFSAFGNLPLHARALDVGAIQTSGELLSLARMEEPFLLTEYLPGELYARDLTRLERSGHLEAHDLDRSDALCDYLARIHHTRSPDSGLYLRRIRELVGHGECVLGLTDSFPPSSLATPARLEAVEHQCVRWRWKLRPLTHRLSQVHGDFHPWNILFSYGAQFSVLDRSRGEWGEPADDVTCLTINYLFFSLRRSGRLEGVFEVLFRRFWDRYLEATADSQMLSIAAPFFAWRALVLVNPLWYPDLDDSVRRKLWSFLEAVLAADRFDPSNVNGYCEPRP